MMGLKLFTSINRDENGEERKAFHPLHQLQPGEAALEMFTKINLCEIGNEAYSFRFLSLALRL